MQGFILTQCQDRNVIGQYGVRRNRNIRFSCTFDAENGDAELPADIQLANAFLDPRLRHFYFKDGVLFINLYIVKNMVGSEANRCPFCHLLFGIDHVICAVAEQKLRLHIAFGAGYYAFGAQLFQQRGGLQRVLEAAAEGADFIKIMTTGLLDFADHGKITGTPLSATDVKEMVHIAHEEGFAVMSHTNGCYGVQAAVEAGVDSIEHGNYMDDETISMLADSESVWVPTLVTVRNLKGCGRFEDTILASIIKTGEQNLKKAFEKKVHVAVGSDAGAYQVLHGQGVQDESRAFFDILGDTQAVRSWMEDGEKRIRTIFCHGSSNLIQV